MTATISPADGDEGNVTVNAALVVLQKYYYGIHAMILFLITCQDKQD